MAVILTENAAREIATICTQQDLELENVYLRVGVRGGGCSGFSYLLDLTEVSRETDEMWEVQHVRVRVRVIRRSLPTRSG